MRIIGIMSGTSVDAVDAALVEFREQDGKSTVQLLAFVALPFSSNLRRSILDACDLDRNRVDRTCVLGTALAHQYAEAARQVAREAGVSLIEVDAIACHGQTIWHQPEPLAIGDRAYRGTMQIGSSAVLAAETGVPVVSDFRSADMAAGGQGAPLVPYADFVLFGDSREHRAVQNIGGIANVTHLPAGGDLSSVTAFDTGPGNMVVDEVVRTLTGGNEQFDRDGHLAAAGTPDMKLVNELMDRVPFFSMPPPKSTGRELFGRAFVHEQFLPSARGRGLTLTDMVATATALTAYSIATAYERWLRPRGYPARVIVGGGGVHNQTLMAMLRRFVSPAVFETHADHGIPDDAKEAIAFAILAHATLQGKPANVPSATGARYPAILGSVTPAPGRGFPRISSPTGDGGE